MVYRITIAGSVNYKRRQILGLLQCIHSMARKNKIKKVRTYINLSKNSYYDQTFDIDLRNPKKGHIYLETEEQSVLGGTYIFEKESGHIAIGKRTHIGASTFISIEEITIGDDVTIAWDCLFYDHNSHSVDWNQRKNDTLQELADVSNGLSMIHNKNWNVVKSAPIHIQDKVWIGVGCKILKGVTIGEGAVVAAGSVVVKDVEPWTMVGGNPAGEIRKLPKCE